MPQSVRFVFKTEEEFLMQADSEKESAALRKEYWKDIGSWMTTDPATDKRYQVRWDSHKAHRLRAWSIRLQLVGQQTERYAVDSKTGKLAPNIPVSTTGYLKPYIAVWDTNKQLDGPPGDSETNAVGYFRRFSRNGQSMKFKGRISEPGWTTDAYAALQSVSLADIIAGIESGITQGNKAILRIVQNKRGNKAPLANWSDSKNVSTSIMPGFQLQVRRPPQPSTDR